MNTIVAIATPPGKAGVGIVRLSGDRSLDLLHLLTHSDRDYQPRVLYRQRVYIEDYSDDAMVVYFRAPQSFTGEDVVEIHAHGGYFLLQKIVSECIRLGATMATRGEFSKRAFINGKLTFDQAEGMIDVINAESTAGLRAGSELLKGTLAQRITAVQDRLTDILAEVETKLDYPEYEFSDDENTDIRHSLEDMRDDLSRLLSTQSVGNVIRDGVKVAIVGEPNVGKSSILNALIQYDKAIVTDIPGTTRDIVEAEYEYGGILFRLYDTAGIRESDDVVESIGIQRAKDRMAESDLVVAVGVAGDDFALDIANDVPVVYVKNKIDLHTDYIARADEVVISAKNGDNIDELKRVIFDKTVASDYDPSVFYLTNARHIQCVRDAIQCLDNAIAHFETMTLDFITSDLRLVYESLGNITGNVSTESIIDRIFSKFCLGK